MTGKEIRRYQMLVRVSRFGMDHAASFPAGTVGAVAFAEVRAAAEALDRHGVAQASARVRDKVVVKDAARERLRASLRAIGRTARALALDAPGLAAKFQAPKTSGDFALLTAARGVSHDTPSSAQGFVDYGLRPTFLADLASQIAAFEQASNDYESVRQRGVAATAGIEAELTRAMVSVRRLDVVVANVLRDDPPALAVWQQARRVDHGRRTAAPESEAAVTPIRIVANAA